MAENRNGPIDRVEPRFSTDESTTTRSRVLSGPPVRPSSLPPPPELEAMDLGWDGPEPDGDLPAAAPPPDRGRPSEPEAEGTAAPAAPGPHTVELEAELARNQHQEREQVAALGAARQQLQELKAQLVCKQDREREQVAALGAAGEQLHELRAKLASTQIRERELAIALERAEGQCSELKAELASRQDRERELAMALEAAEGQCRELEARVKALQNSVDRSGDDLTAIRGIGPAFERALRALGVHTYSQIAAWSDEQIADIADRLRTHPTRILREDWVESAKRLSRLHAPRD